MTATPRPRKAPGGPTAPFWCCRVDGPRAIELQHRSDQILERLNVYFGYRAIAQLRFLQAPHLAGEAGAVAAVPASVPDEASIPAAISDSSLRQALARLGASLRHRLRI